MPNNVRTSRRSSDLSVDADKPFSTFTERSLAVAVGPRSRYFHIVVSLCGLLWSRAQATTTIKKNPVSAVDSIVPQGPQGAMSGAVRRYALTLLVVVYTFNFIDRQILAILLPAIQEEFGISQPAVSQHLRVLRDSGFASVRTEGARRFYAVEPAALREVDAWLDRFRRFWEQRLDALETELARGRRAARTTAGKETNRRAGSGPGPADPLAKEA